MNLMQQFQFVESQAAYRESMARMIQHGSIQHPGLVFISREANPNADSIIYYSYDGTGSMIDVANRASDIPVVAVERAQHTVGIHWKALAYDWSDRELNRATMMGIPLPDDKLRICFRIAEEEKERVFLEGDADKGWDSFVDFPRVPRFDTNTSWHDATGLQIFQDVNALLTNSYSRSNQVRICDTLLLPVGMFGILGNPMGGVNDTRMSILQYIKQHNVYTELTDRPLMIKTLRQLKGGGQGGTSRAIAYPRDRNVVRYHIPQELMFSEAQRLGLGWKRYGHMVLAGIEWMEPNVANYLDGIETAAQASRPNT